MTTTFEPICMNSTNSRDEDGDDVQNEQQQQQQTNHCGHWVGVEANGLPERSRGRLDAQLDGDSARRRIKRPAERALHHRHVVVA